MVFTVEGVLDPIQGYFGGPSLHWLLLHKSRSVMCGVLGLAFNCDPHLDGGTHAVWELVHSP